MGTDAGAAGAFGLLLSNYPAVADVYEEWKQYILTLESPNLFSDEDEDDEPKEGLDSDDLDDPIKNPRLNEFVGKFKEAFAKHNILVPRTATLLYTDTEDARPACCATPSEDWVLGFGLFTLPWNYPVMHKSFRNLAGFHTWVWMG
jgi:hypothetical protein